MAAGGALPYSQPMLVGDSSVARFFERAFGVAACAASVALLVAALLLGVRADAAAGARISAASVRLATVAGRPAAGYFILRGGAADDLLVAVASPLATRVELHDSSMAGGVMRMNTLPAVAVPAHASVAFAPGGNHLMIFGLRGDVKPGATIPLVFRFRSGTSVRADAVAVAPGVDMAMPDHAKPPHGPH